MGLCSLKEEIFWLENKNLIAIAKVATPVRKRETDSYTFKLKLDLATSPPANFLSYFEVTNYLLKCSPTCIRFFGGRLSDQIMEGNVWGTSFRLEMIPNPHNCPFGAYCVEV